MFKELVPVLRDRAVLLTVTLVDADQIRVNIVPKKLKDGDNDALTTPLSVTGTAEDLDAELSTTIISFVGSHLQMKNTLEKAKAEMDAASKAAQAEARAKSKTPTKTAPPNTEVTQYAPTAKPAEPAKPAPPEARKPLRYAGTGGHNHRHACRIGRRPWICRDRRRRGTGRTEELDDAA
jgi:PRTRC genetic system protein E